jgi:beta-glycosidase
MLSLKYKFERRIGLYPAAFDKDGVMYSSAAFGDYPNRNADYDIADPADRFTGWMLLSYRKPVAVSSTVDGMDPAAISDENMRTYWAARSAAPGEWAMIDLGPDRTVRAIQVNYYEYLSDQTDRADDMYFQYRIYASDNGDDWTLVVDKSDNDRDCPHDYVELLEPLKTRYLKLENIHTASGNFCLSDIRVFGSAEGPAPEVVKGFKVVRDKKDPRNAMISWQPSERAYGYNIYYGIAPDKMYNAITVNGDTSYDMRGLDLGTDYFFAVEALGESGRSALSKTIRQ